MSCRYRLCTLCLRSPVGEPWLSLLHWFLNLIPKVRLVQQLDKPGWRNMRDVLDLLPGPSFEDTQQVAPESRPRSQAGAKVVMVMFVGGCTMAEVAALRFLSQQEENNVEYLVATTSIITGESFLESLATKLEAPAF